MKITIRDVASRADVSISTVSRVLNRPEIVDADTKKRVISAMNELNFKPNAIARGLSSRHTNTLGLIVPGINNFFFNELYRGVEKVSRESGMKVLLFDSQDSKIRALEAFSFLKQHQVEGVIFTSKVVDDEFIPILERIDIPVVLALTEGVGKTRLPAYRVDDVKGVFDAVAYLVSRGHQRIGFISGTEQDGDKTGELRILGYKTAIQHFSLPYVETFIEAGDYRFDSGYSAMNRLLRSQSQNRLTGICAASDEMAIGAMQCLYDNGLRVPDDISLIGFDDLIISRMVRPALTTVEQPFAEIGASAVRCLLDMLQSQDQRWPMGIYYLPHRIVERDTVRSLRGDE